MSNQFPTAEAKMEQNNRIEAFTLVDQAIRLQMGDDSELQEIEKCLKKALDLDPDSIEVLQEIAHFYDAVKASPPLARKYASLCREKALSVVTEMDGILVDSEEATQEITMN
jgi:hypothetical protein